VCLVAAEELGDAAAVDGIVERAAYARVVERRREDVEEHVPEPEVGVGVEPCAVPRAELGEVADLALEQGDVRVAASHCGDLRVWAVEPDGDLVGEAVGPVGRPDVEVSSTARSAPSSRSCCAPTAAW
jgi:hypothetical protein